MIRAKIVVVGPGEAGKSTLIAALARRPMNLAVGGRTVAMDHGTIKYGEDVLSIVGVPGQGRFGAVQEALVRGARGAVWVHPAGEQPDAPTVKILAGLAAESVPYLVFVNQREGDADRAVPFAVPSPLPPPKAILFGNLLAPEGSLVRLEAETWKLIAR